MKKILLAICALAVGISAVHAQQLLNVAIQGSVGELSDTFENGSRVAVLAMYSDSALMSDHLISEMLVALMSMQHARGITVVNRVQLNTFAAQLNFDTAGLIDDAVAESIGRQMYVRYVVTGAFEPSGDFFRLRLQVMDIQTSALRSTRYGAVFMAIVGGAVFFTSCDNLDLPTITVIFDANGGTGTVPSQVVGVNSGTTLPDGSGLYGGGWYIFEGWSTNPDSWWWWGNIHHPGDTFWPGRHTMDGTTVTLYAIWSW